MSKSTLIATAPQRMRFAPSLRAEKLALALLH